MRSSEFPSSHRAYTWKEVRGSLATFLCDVPNWGLDPLSSRTQTRMQLGELPRLRVLIIDQPQAT